VFLIHAWAIVVILYEAPAWSLQLDAWDLVGAASYPLVVATVESVVVLGLVSALAAALPRTWLRGAFVASATGIVYLAGVWAVVAHLNDQMVRAMSIRELAAWAAFFVVSEVAVVWAIHRSRRLKSVIQEMVDRLVLPAALYIVLSIFAVVVVVARNLGVS
jgi:hypothetical protein